MNRRAIGPLFSTIIVIVLVLAAAVLAWSYLAGWVAPAAIRPPSAITVDSVRFDGAIIIAVRNTGGTSAKIVDVILKAANGTVIETQKDGILPLVVPAGSTRSFSVGARIGPGVYEVRVLDSTGATASGTLKVDGTVLDNAVGLLSPSYEVSSPLKPLTGWSAEIYDTRCESYQSIRSKLLAGNYTPVWSGTVPYIDFSDNPRYGGFDWPSSKRDCFAARFMGVMYARQPVTLNVELVTDDGSLLLVDNSTVLDAWRLQAPTTYFKTLRLQGGYHTITLYYFENRGIARVKLTLAQSNETGLSVHARYYRVPGGMNLRSESDRRRLLDSLLAGGQGLSLILEEDESGIDYSDREGYGGSPWPIGQGDVNRFAALYEFDYSVAERGAYELTVTSDDGVYVEVDGEKVLEDWTLHAPRTVKQTVELEAGTHHFRIAYFENYGIARLMLSIKPVSGREGSENPVEPGAWTVKIYDTGGWDNCRNTQEIMDLLESESLSLIGEYSVGEVLFSDNPNYPGSPWPHIAAGSNEKDHFAAIISSTIRLERSGQLVIKAKVDDGLYVEIDGLGALNAWRCQAPTSHSATVPVTAGTHEVLAYYFERGGTAYLNFSLYYRESPEAVEVFPGSGNELTISISGSAARKLTLNGSKNLIVTVADAWGEIIGRKVLRVTEDGLQNGVTVTVKLGKSLPRLGVLALWRRG